MIADGTIDFLVFFWDPLEPQPHDTDVKSLLRIAVVWNIPVACDRASADFMISSPLMTGSYERRVPDYSAHNDRELPGPRSPNGPKGPIPPKRPIPPRRPTAPSSIRPWLAFVRRGVEMPSSDRVRWGILGPGRIAARLLREADRAANVSVVAVGSRSHERAAQLASKFGIARVHDSYEALLADPQVDAVYIGLPNSLHHP